MLCEYFRDRYDRLDAGEEPGVLLRAHLALCPACREEAARSKAALAAYRNALYRRDAHREDFEGPGTDKIEERVMAAVRILPRPRRVVSFRDWIVSGLVIAISMALIPFGNDFNSIKALFGTSFTLPLMLALSLVITLYGAVFIATHMDELAPFVRRHLPAPRV
jgi:hypothetical protein